jgi:hypothetical protein
MILWMIDILQHPFIAGEIINRIFGSVPNSCRVPWLGAIARRGVLERRLVLHLQ